MKLIIWAIIIILLSNVVIGFVPINYNIAQTQVTVSTSCNKTTYFQKIVSSCKNPNDVCEYGENLGLDKDCKFDANTAIYQFWFVRLMILLSIIFFFINKPNFAIMAILVAAALVMYNVSLMSDIPVTLDKQPQTIEKCTLKNIGSCLTPTQPLLGWFIVLLLLYGAIRWLYKN